MLVHGVYDLGGWRGPIRLKAVISGRTAIPAVRNQDHVLNYLSLSERASLLTAIDFNYDSIETRREELVDELMRNLARHFGMDEFPP